MKAQQETRWLIGFFDSRAASIFKTVKHAKCQELQKTSEDPNQWHQTDAGFQSVMCFQNNILKLLNINFWHALFFWESKKYRCIFYYFWTLIWHKYFKFFLMEAKDLSVLHSQ